MSAADAHSRAVPAQRFVVLFSALSDGVLATDEGGVVVEANPAAQRLLGRRVLGAPIAEVLPPGRAEIVERREDRLVRRWRMPGEDREVVLEVVTTRSLDEIGRPAGAVHALRDITSQAQLTRLKEQFIFDVAHELRTPVASLTASLDLLHQDAPSLSRSELRTLVNALRRSALRLQALVENLLDVGSMQAGTFEVRAVRSSLRRCVSDALFLVRPLTELKQQEVAVAIPRSCDIVIADPRRTTQVLANLLSNASKYAPERSRIDIAAQPVDGFTRLAVRDRGPGIPQEERARVFDRFYRSRTVRDRAGGIGLGLAICHAIVEAQGGRIGIETPDEGGTVVHFTVPRARATATQEEPA